MSIESAARRAWIDVDLTALLANARTVLEASAGPRLLPMVKANAYGLGVAPVVRALERLEPWGYGVANVDEGVELRDLGISRPIIVFTPSPPDHFSRLRAYDLRPVLDDPESIRTWGGVFHLEIDTGMGRAGIPWYNTSRLDGALAAEPEGVFTHFHSADETAESVTAQEERFAAVLRRRPAASFLVHAENSAGAFRTTGQYDLVRPGIFLYGGSAGLHGPLPAPVVTVAARVVSLRTIRPGETVSYGATWSPAEETVVATLGIGYADGIRRSLQGRAEVLIRDRRYPVVGRVTMDMTMVALGPDGGDVTIGDEGVLIGGRGARAIALDEVAGWAGTVSYEILTGLGARLPRSYRGSA